MCNGRLEALGKGMEIAAAGALSSRRLKAAQLVVTLEGLPENDLTVQNGDFNAHQLPAWFNKQALEVVGDAKWKLFCDELDSVRRGYRYTNAWLQQLPWIILGIVTVVPHSCFAGVCVLIAGGRFERKQLIDQHKELTDKFLKGELDEHALSKPNSAQGLQPLSCTNWEQLFRKGGYTLASSTRTEAIFSEGQEENYFVDITFSPVSNESTA
jgi:hypothetical protein